MPESPTIASVLALVALGALGSGCASPPWKREVAYARAGVVLYRETLPPGDPRAPSFLHPVDVSEGTLAAVLEETGFEKSYYFRSAERKSVFTPEEARALSAALAPALRTLAPDERIRFLVTRSNWSDALTGLTGTSGVVFRTDEATLNIAFDYLCEKLLGAQSGDPAEIVYREEPTDRRGGNPLVPGPATRLHEGEQPRPRWLVVDLAAARAHAASRPEVAAPAPAAPAGPSAPAAPAAPAPTVPPEAGTATAPVPVPGSDPGYETIRTQVETLKKLRSDGVLTEEEYQRALDRVLAGRDAGPDAKYLVP